MPQRYLTLDDLAEIFNCTNQTITRWAKDENHAFPSAFYIGHRPMWDSDEIQDYVKSLRGSDNSEAA